MHKRINTGIILISVLLIGSAVAYTYESRRRSSNPELFWKAIETGLTSKGVSCQINDTSDGRTSQQTVQLDLQQQHHSATRTVIKKDGNEVITEGLNTPQAEYIRYQSIKTDQKNAAGQQLDFLNVIDVWGKQAVDPARPSSLYGQTVLGGCIVPLAYANPIETAAYMNLLRKGDVFKTDVAQSATETYEGQKLQAYKVTVQPGPYFSLMKKLAEDNDLRDLDTIAPAQFAARKPEAVTFLIDSRQRQIRAITFDDKTRSIKLTDYGTRPRIIEPSPTIPTTELEARLKAVQ